MPSNKPSKTKPKNRVRRKFSDTQKTKIVEFANEHSVKEASEKYKVHGTLIGRWRANGFGKPVRKPNKRVQRKSTIKPVEEQLREVQAENRALQGENRILRDIVVDGLLAKKAG